MFVRWCFWLNVVCFVLSMFNNYLESLFSSKWFLWLELKVPLNGNFKTPPCFFQTRPRLGQNTVTFLKNAVGSLQLHFQNAASALQHFDIQWVCRKWRSAEGFYLLFITIHVSLFRRHSFLMIVAGLTCIICQILKTVIRKMSRAMPKKMPIAQSQR